MKNIFERFDQFSQDAVRNVEIDRVPYVFPLSAILAFVFMLSLVQIALLPITLVSLIARNLLRNKKYFGQKWMKTLIRYIVALSVFPESLIGATFHWIGYH